MNHTQVPCEVFAEIEETVLNAAYNAKGIVFSLWYALKLKK